MNKHLIFILSIIFFLFCPYILYGQSKRALLVGISDYESSANNTGWTNINGTNDVKLIYKDLKSQGFTDIQLLTDSQGTYKNIIKGLNRLIIESSKGDIVYFHFSGHGQPILDKNKDEGVDDCWDESIIPIDAALFYSKGIYEGEHHITDDLLNEKFIELRAKVGKEGMVYAVLDACYSGTGVRGESIEAEAPERGVDLGFDFGEGIFYDAPIKRQTKYTLTSTNSLSHILVLEACLPHQKNREIKINDLFYGPLSYYIHKTLQHYKIDKEARWTQQVISSFKKDQRTFNQNIVCETSLNNGKGN